MVSPDRRWMVGRINNDQNNGTDRDASTQGSISQGTRGEEGPNRKQEQKRASEQAIYGGHAMANRRGPAAINTRPRIKIQNTKRTKKKKKKRKSKARGNPKRGRQAIVAPCVEECMTDAGRWRTQLRLIGSGREDWGGKQEESHGGPSMLVSIIILGSHNY